MHGDLQDTRGVRCLHHDRVICIFGKNRDSIDLCLDLVELFLNIFAAQKGDRNTSAPLGDRRRQIIDPFYIRKSILNGLHNALFNLLRRCARKRN